MEGVFDNNELQIINEIGIKFKNIIQIEGDDQMLSNLYKNAESFIFPSLYEGFGLPAIEAMSYECPVLLSSIDVFREIADDSHLFFLILNHQSQLKKKLKILFIQRK